jgi:hypothetical protein
MRERGYKLLSASGKVVDSAEPGVLGGNSRLRIYGRLDCHSAVRALPKGYAKHRVFFADETTARAAGYRPCGVCMRRAYARWKAAQGEGRQAGV